jgi:hypothetical protein
MDYVPTRFGYIAGGMSFPVLFVFNAWYTHIATRAHCGYALPVRSAQQSAPLQSELTRSIAVGPVGLDSVYREP